MENKTFATATENWRPTCNDGSNPVFA